MTNGFVQETASKALAMLARQEQYSTARDEGFSRWVDWAPTADGGAIARYEDGTVSTFTAADLEAAADERG
jgi:hypothetical protein